MPAGLPEPAYPAEAAVRKVRSNGEIKWRGELIFVACALVGEAVALEEAENGDVQVRFFDRRLGVIDRKNPKLRPHAVKKSEPDGRAKTENQPKSVNHLSG